MSVIDDIAEMICIAYGERYENKAPHEKQHINTWANSIYEHINNTNKSQLRT